MKTFVRWGWVSAPIRVPSMVSLDEGRKKTHHKTHLGRPRCEKTWPQFQLKFFGHWLGFVLVYFCSALGLKSVGIRYKLWYMDLGLEFINMAPISHCFNFYYFSHFAFPQCDLFLNFFLICSLHVTLFVCLFVCFFWVPLPPYDFLFLTSHSLLMALFNFLLSHSL